MTDLRQPAIEYAHQNRDRFLQELKDLLVIPSISTDPENVPDILRAAEFLANLLRGMGMQNVKIYPTARHPVVFGESLAAGNAPTVLVYGHYDVQPVDPIDLWETGPFEPTVRGQNLYARGASDMKGQTMAAIKAVESIIKSNSGKEWNFPVNIKWMIEGEEEIGSPSLEAFMQENKELLKADFCLNCDSGMIAPDAPCLTYALRGLQYFEIYVRGPAHDLHSGIFGGVVHNPANVLAKLIAGMHDEKGRITLPGFYDKVRPIPSKERIELARLPMNEQYYLTQTGAPALHGESGYSPAERAGSRPTLDVNGMLSGFIGPGSKTVIPAWAMAKISTRLVPDQDPKEVYKQMVRYMEKNAPKTVTWEVKDLHGGAPSISSIDSTPARALVKALEEAWGVKPYFKREGGSVPVVISMQKILGIDSVLTGFGLPDDNLHAPNEKLHLPTWYRGIDALVHFFWNLK